MFKAPSHFGPSELLSARNESCSLYVSVAAFSFLVNLLMLTGPLYMLNVYDRVLGSGSEATLIALSLLVGFLFLMMGLLDFVRGRVMSRVGARFQARLDRRVFTASLNATTQNKALPQAATALSDLESIQRLIISPALMALFDLPWAPLFFASLFIFHPMIGLLGLAGAVILIILAFFNQKLSHEPLAQANSSSFVAQSFGQKIRSESDMVRALGMQNSVFSRWETQRNSALGSTIRASDYSGSFTITIKTFRMFLQSMVLGLGAYLVLQGEMTPGGMIAGSILLGRALAPIELIVGQWASFQKARQSWKNLGLLLKAVPPSEDHIQLPSPKAHIDVQNLSIVPPGMQTAVLKSLTFKVSPGEAVGVIGTSGCGKSTLAKALTGIWPPAAGHIRLDGAALDQYDTDVLGEHIGYLPQSVQLFEGTIKDNIARMSVQPDDAAIIDAAKRAAAHHMILSLPDGYDTVVSTLGGRLSGGQIQRIGLARALYNNPVLLVLDEPNSNLDNDGSLALNTAIRTSKAAGCAIFIMAHRPAAIEECDKLLMLEQGVIRAFGPTKEVIAAVMQNAQELQKTKTPEKGVK